MTLEGSSDGRRHRSEETETPKARSGAGVDSRRSGGALPAQARLLLSLQSKAGNRAVTALLQRKVLVDGRWYGKKDEAELQTLKGPKKLPDWSPFHLNDDVYYVVNPAGTGWVEDNVLLFYRFKRVPDPNKEGQFLYPKQGYKKVGASGRDPFGEAGIPGAGQTRLNPKHAERPVSRVRIYKYSKQTAGHWMLECEVTGVKAGVKYMKIDLTNDGYRIYYGVDKTKPTKESDEVSFDLAQPTPVSVLYELFVRIAKDRGKRTGTHLYNCQDFALIMLQELKVQQQQALATEAEWRDRERASLGGNPID